MQKNKVLPFFEKKFYTVSELTEEIKAILEDDFFDIKVIGEISNLSTPLSGHSYFTLKDKNASIRCVLFRSQKNLLNFNFKNGDEVLVRGRISVYSPRGEYQIIVDYLEAYGTGKLFLQVERLKQQLEKEGLFSECHKRSIPAYPEKIVVITSKTGAAVRDILNIVKRRFSGVELYILPVQVQGDGADEQIANAIKFINNNFSDSDIIIVARGGGSIEDLMPFNSEKVARAIFSSEIPIISAVGHETDFTISDLVADLRAPTPSAAAELVVKNKTDLILHLDNLEKRLISVTMNNINRHKTILSKSENILLTFYSKLKNLKYKILSLEKIAASALKNLIYVKKEEFYHLKFELENFNPHEKISKYRETINNLEWKLISGFTTQLHSERKSFHFLLKSLNNLSPLNILARGYSITYKDEQIVKDISQVEVGDEINIKISNGSIKAQIKEKSNKNNSG